MAQQIICPACGAKLKSTRKRCLRCGEPLTAPSNIRSSTKSVRRSGPPRHRMLVMGALLLVGLGSALAMVLGNMSSAGSAPVASAAIQSPTRSANPSIAAVPEPGFLDPKHGGTVAYAQGDYGTALERYQKAIATNPNDADALNNLGQVLARTGKPDQAIQYFERAIKLYPNVWAYRFNLAHAFGQKGDWDRAVAEYGSAQALFPDDYVTEFNLASALHKQGRDSDAVAGYQKAISLAPGEASFHRSLGLSYEKLNRLEDAAASYQRYLELAPDAADVQQVKARIQAITGRPAAPAADGNPPSAASQG